VVRVPHDSDRRRTDVTITESGAAEIVGHLTPMFTALHELDSTLDDHDREVVEAYLRGAIAALRRLL
jgi:DNA-binding MarR family transcriptional regulator